MRVVARGQLTQQAEHILASFCLNCTVFLARSSVMISKRFDAYRGVLTERGTQGLSVPRFAGLSSELCRYCNSGAYSQQGPREDVHSKTDACLQRGPTYFWGPSIHDAVFQLISLCVAMFIGTGMQ